MFDKISLRALCAYEKMTGNNAMELFSKVSKSATDLRDLAFLIKSTEDKTTTLESIENLSGPEFEAVIKSMTEEVKT